MITSSDFPVSTPPNTPGNRLVRVVLVTQDDPFYLGQALDYFLQRLPPTVALVGAVVLSNSFFGKDQGLIAKAHRTWSIFGAHFFFHYALRYLATRLDRRYHVLKVLQGFGVPLLAIENINDAGSTELIRTLAPDVLLSIQANQIFHRILLSIPHLACLNLHTGMLPKYRGLMPTFWALKNDEREIGVTVFMMDEGVDSGPIFVQKSFPIKERVWDSVIRTTKILGMDACIEALEKISRRDMDTFPNNGSQMPKYSVPTREDVKEFLKGNNRFY